MVEVEFKKEKGNGSLAVYRRGFCRPLDNLLTDIFFSLDKSFSIYLSIRSSKVFIFREVALN